VIYTSGANPIVRLLAVATVLAVLLGFVPAPAWAQAAPVSFSAGWYVTPSFRLSEEFDDNIFATSSGKQWDFISRFSPGLEAGYRSEPFTLLASGGFDAEVYARDPQLNDATSGWHAGLTSRYLPIRPLTLGLDVAYTETRSPSTIPLTLTPALIAPATVLQFGLRRATFLTASPSLAYSFSPVTAGTAAYAYTHDTIEGGLSSTTHTATFGLTHDFTPLDKGILGFRSTVYDTEGSPTTEDYAPTIGYTRRLTDRTSITLQGGPRFTSDGSVGPEVSARLDHQFKLGKAYLAYARSQGFVLGEAGVVETETFSGGVDFEPVKSLLVSVSPSITRLSGGTTADTTVYALGASASYPILRWLLARASYQFYYQQEHHAGDIPRNIVTFSLEASYPYRFGQ
jgi:hypothetical protein